MVFSRRGMAPVSFLPQNSGAACEWGAQGGKTVPSLCPIHWRGSVCPRRSACQNRANSCWVGRRALLECPMLAVFVPSESSLKKVAVDLVGLPESAVWIDLVKPTSVEDKAVERLAGIAVPTREDMQEIEISSRLYIENGARYMTATLMCQSDTDMPKTTAVTFILAGHRLVTVRYDEPKPFALVEHKLARSCMPGISGEMVLMELLDAVIDRCADILERCGAEIDQVSHDIFEPESARHGQAKRYSQILIAIGRKGDLVSKIRESLVSIGR